MLSPKQRNLNEKTPIEQCIRLIQDTKNQMKVKVTEHLTSFRQKILASLQKVEKTYIAKINQSCINSIDVLIKMNNTQLTSLQVQKYTHKTNKLIQQLKKLDIETQLKNFNNQIKANIEQLRKLKIFEELTKITQQKQLMKLQKTIKVEGQPLSMLAIINKKLVEIKENSVSIQKNTINKSFDVILPIKLQNKGKQILFTLNDSTIGLYNDKLVLHSYRKFNYLKGQIVGITQIKNYVFIAQKNKLTRINLNNLNQILVRVFNEQITVLGNQIYNNFIQIAINQKLQLLDFDTLQPMAHLVIGSRITRISATKQSSYLLVCHINGLKIYRNLQEIEVSFLTRNIKAQLIVPIMNEIIIITNQLHIYFLKFGQEGQFPQPQRINQGLTKIIRSAACQGYQIFALSENGTRIYVHTF